MANASEAFGARLRVLRMARGLSLSELARRLFYSKGHVSKIENGEVRPSVEFARRCDAELAADGALAALVPATKSDQAPRSEPHPEGAGTWLMMMAPDGASSFVSVERRDLLGGGAVLLAGLAPAGGPSPSNSGNIHHFAQLLITARELGQVAAPETVLPFVVCLAHGLRLLAHQNRADDARAVAALSARTAEFAGWMAQESGDDQAAMWWTRLAVRTAAAADDPHTAMYALVRQASISLYRGDAAETVALARSAQSQPDTPRRILGLAAQREAQGHALAGNYTDCLRALDVARCHLTAAVTDHDSTPVIGASHVPDLVAAVTGWCLYDLGKPAKAAAILAHELTRIAPSAVRTRLRFGIRQALGCAAAGDIDHACALTQTMLEQVPAVKSATLQADLRRLAATLRRFPLHPAVCDLAPVLTDVLHPTR